MNVSMNQARVFTSRHHIWMMTAICMGAFLSHFTAGIVNVSLPQFTRIFQTNLAEVQWITTGYLLVITSLLPLMGKLGDRYGYRLIHNLGYVSFTISSIMVAFSTNLTILLILRMVQAIGASMFQATNIALITIHLPKEKRGRALGIVSTAVALGGMTGPIIGGWIAAWFSWQWLFLIHVPVAFAATLLAFRFIPVRGQERKRVPLDKVGALLFIVMISSFIFGISNGSRLGWLSSETLFVFAVTTVALSMLLVWEPRQRVPFLPIKAFRIPAVFYGLLISTISFLLANTVLVLLPFYLFGIAAISPSTAGYILAAYPVSLAFTGPLCGYLSDRYGSRRFMFLGLCGIGSGFAALALYLGPLSIIEIAAILALIGLGMGLIASPNNSFIMKHAPAEHIGSIGGMIALTRNAGMVCGAALGLGIVNGGDNHATGLESFRAAFGINVLICAGALIIFGCGIYFENVRRKNKPKMKEAHKQNTLEGEKTL
ncbi:MFS transporter [Paenibacillus baekrokdamisoli]|uniref:MFS transporter n=1 Tax=Paenibacillus baekrokdamisoli TaxID=1712516 RepID=A0A3G9J1P5_9BACL|nr:MFS transporter [Paenibacillus baekrokdamisoli]MBB3073347.1 EmrB/QacA subfamily drug resistance transporter [Paenibacillus baekrokdamisoli]BBH22305.1 MFS transporter [Paenibacillus baekrokdamisoli]